MVGVLELLVLAGCVVVSLVVCSYGLRFEDCPQFRPVFLHFTARGISWLELFGLWEQQFSSSRADLQKHLSLDIALIFYSF